MAFIQGQFSHENGEGGSEEIKKPLSTAKSDRGLVGEPQIEKIFLYLRGSDTSTGCITAPKNPKSSLVFQNQLIILPSEMRAPC
jgi:hypothetical protein